MTRRSHALVTDDDYSPHLESGLQYVTLCGRVFNPDAAEREPYRNEPGDPHAEICFDCETVANGGSIAERRRELHFDRGASA